MSNAHLFGPLISTTDLERLLDLFADGLGLEVAEHAGLSQRQVRDRFGVVGRRAELVVLVAPGSEAGVCLVEFDPPEAAARGNRAPCEPPELVFEVTDLEATCRSLTASGFEVEREDVVADVSRDVEDRSGSGLVRAVAGEPGGGEGLAAIADVQCRLVQRPPAGSGITAEESGAGTLQAVVLRLDDPEPALKFYRRLGVDCVPGARRSADRTTGGPAVVLHGGVPSDHASGDPLGPGVSALCLWVSDPGERAEATRPVGGTVRHRSEDGGSLWLLGPHGVGHWLIRAAG